MVSRGSNPIPRLDQGRHGLWGLGKVQLRRGAGAQHLAHGAGGDGDGLGGVEQHQALAGQVLQGEALPAGQGMALRQQTHHGRPAHLLEGDAAFPPGRQREAQHALQAALLQQGCRLGSSSRSRRNAGASHSRWRWNTLPKAKGTKGWSWGWANLSKARWVRAWICWASLRKASPSAVRLTLRVVRWNKVAPSSFSREWICWVTAGWVT